MEGNHSGRSSKAQVVYYLCRNGKTEPPHMIQVPHLANEGLRLKDVKRQLTVLRGSAMSNMFSWSYKRTYKNKYIWLDLSDEDVILPGSGGEYVLKGSEFFDDCQDKMMKHVFSQEFDTHKQPEVLHNKFRGAESWLKQDTQKSSSDRCPSSSLKPEIAEKSTRLPQVSRNTLKTEIEKNLFPVDDAHEVCKRAEKEGFTTPEGYLVDNKISSSSDLSDSSATHIMNDIKMLHIKSSVNPTRNGCDASTQTDLDNGASNEALRKQENVNSSRTSNPTKFLMKELQEYKPSVAETSLLSMISGEEHVSDQNLSCKSSHDQAVKCSQSRDNGLNGNVRLKHTTASRVFLQILSCGGIDGKVQRRTSNEDRKATKLDKIHSQEHSAGQAQGTSQPPSRDVGSKPVTPRGHRSPESFKSIKGTASTYGCELELDNRNNLNHFDHTFRPCSGGEVVTAIPSPSNDDLSKLAGRCSSSSRRSSRSTDFDTLQDKKIKEVGTAFGTPCKTPGGSPVASGPYKSANASRVSSPARLLSSEGDSESWESNVNQILRSTRTAGKILNQAVDLQNPEPKWKWKDVGPIKRDLSKLVEERS